MQGTDLSLHAIKCCSVVFGITLRLLVINISSSSPAINKLCRLLPAVSVTTCRIVVRRRHVDNTWPLASHSTDGLPHLHLIPPLGGSRRNIARPFGMEKLEWLGYPMAKNSEDMFVCFDRIDECDRQTDTQTDTAWRHRPRLCIALCGNKIWLLITTTTTRIGMF